MYFGGNKLSFFCLVMNLSLHSTQEIQVVTTQFTQLQKHNKPKQGTDRPMFNISLEGGCLKCGSPCLSAVAGAVPGCVAPGLAAGGALAGGVVDLNISAGISSNNIQTYVHNFCGQMCSNV